MDNDWIDESTRAVFVEFVMFNNAHRLFSSVQLTVEIPPIGNTFTGRTTVRSYRQHYVMSGMDVLGKNLKNRSNKNLTPTLSEGTCESISIRVIF